MVNYFLGEEFDFSEIQAEASLPGNYDLEVEFLTSTIKETEETVVFRLTLGGSVVCEPTILDGIVYFTSCDGNIYAVNLDTGREHWRFNTQGPIITRVTYGHGRLYSTSYDGNLYCLDMNGNLVWKFHTGDKLAAGSVIHKDRIYFGCKDGNLYAVNRNGGLDWRFTTGGPIGAHATVYKDRIYFGSLDYHMYAVDLDGNLVWKFMTGNQVGGPAISNGVIYFGSFDQCVYAVNTEGKLLWKFETEDAIPVGTSVSAFGDTVYFGSRDYNVYAVRNGRLLWKFKTENMVFSEPLEEEGRVYFCSSDGNLYVVDKETGRELWRFTAGGPALFPAKSGDTIIFSCHDCNVYAINTKGKLLWKFHTSLNYPAMLEESHEYEHTVIIPTRIVGSKREGEERVKAELGNYGDLKGSYIGEDLRDYIGKPIEKEGMPGMAYKSRKQVYRK